MLLQRGVFPQRMSSRKSFAATRSYVLGREDLHTTSWGGDHHTGSCVLIIHLPTIYSHHVLYAKSLAVCSVVGFILGLGDRHTNNLMLDPLTGEIFHIDFGMSFDFARDHLPVREIVPFRMTRDIVAIVVTR